jgi:hypothetical protein
MIDEDSDLGYAIKMIGPATIPIQAQQQDSSATPGAASTNRNDVWRWLFTDWTHGVGQTWMNDPQSDTQRFRTSKGVDVWTPGQISLLTTTTNLQSSSTAYTYFAAYPSVVGDSISPAIAIFYFDTVSATPKYRRILLNSSDTITNGPTSLTGFTGTHGGSATGRNVVHGGSLIYMVDGSTGIVYAANGNTAVSPKATVSALTVILGIGYAKNRLLAWGGSGFKVVDCTGGGTISSPTFTLIADQGNIVDIAEGSSVIYLSANLDGKAEIYSITADAQSTALTNIKRAARLPVGETIYATFGYQGLLFIGTNRGFRTAVELSDGSLQVGSLVDIGKPVRCFNAIGPYVYFGWSNYDGTDGGLGRINPSIFTDNSNVVPAYATDIMAASNTNNILDILAFDNGAGTVKPYFNTSDKFYAMTATAVSSGTLNTGFVNFGLADQKSLVGIDLTTQSLVGSVATSITAANGGTPTSIATYSTASGVGTHQSVNYIGGREHELTLTLTAGASAPVVTGAQISAVVAPSRSESYQMPLLIADRVTDLQGKEWVFDPLTLIAGIRTAANTQTTPSTVQWYSYTASMFIVDYEFHQHNFGPNGPQGTLVVDLKSLQP